jgi:hypothetical protein
MGYLNENILGVFADSRIASGVLAERPYISLVIFSA